MAFKTKIILLAVLALPALCPPSHAQSLGRVTGNSGAAPAAVTVEQPQDALKYWRSRGLTGRSLIIISEDLPLFPIDEDATARAIRGMADGRWDEFLARPYKTTVYYPVNRATYVYLAARAGIVSRVYWVPPTREPLDEGSLERVKAHFSALGATQAELEAAAYSDRRVCGAVKGVPVCVCGLGELPAIDGEALLAIDLSFFTGVYKNEVNTPILDMLSRFMHTLSDSGVKVSDAVISCSTTTGGVPLEQRFIAGYIKRFLTEPDSLAAGPPKTWLLRSEAMYYETFFQPDEALRAYKEAVEAQPDDPSLRFDLAMAYFSKKDVDRMKQELDTAVSLDKGYYPAYITYGRYFANKGVTLAAEDFVEAAVRACPEDPEAWKAEHDVMRATGKYKDAVAAQKRFIALGYDGAEPHYHLAQDYASMGEYGLAAENYKKSLGMLPLPESSLRPQVLVGLAEAYEKSNKIKEALDTYKEAMDATADQHARTKLNEKYETLKKRWAPFMRGVGGG